MVYGAREPDPSQQEAELVPKLVKPCKHMDEPCLRLERCVLELLQREGFHGPPGQGVMTTNTLQGANSIRLFETEPPRHQRAAQLSRCLCPTTISSA